MELVEPQWVVEFWADAEPWFDRWDAPFDALDVEELPGNRYYLPDEPGADDVGWVDTRCDADVVARADGVGSADRSSLSERGEPDALGAAIDRIAALEQRKATIEAEQARVLAQMVGPAPDGDLVLVDELRCALRISAAAARARLETSRVLAAHLPATLGALATGRCSLRHAQVAVDAVTTVLPALGPDEISRLDGVAARAVSEETTSGVRRKLARAVIAVDPHGADRRHELAKVGRRVFVYGESDAMASLVLTSTATDVAAVYARLDAIARGLPTTDPRSMDARRADALVEAVLFARVGDGSDHALGDGARQEARGRGGRIEVTISATTLAGDSVEPGYLAGYGPIPPGLARRVAADPTSTWRRLVTDPLSGALLDYGRRTYRPPADLRDFVTARDGVCAFPGCAVPARRCDLDHIEPFGSGVTAPENLAPLCRRHHRAKTVHDFDYRRERDGTHQWTTPSGHRYVSHPPRPWVDGPAEPDGDLANSALPQSASAPF